MADRAIVALNVSILTRLSRLYISQLDTVLFSPSLEVMADVFQSIVQTYYLRLATPFNERVGTRVTRSDDVEKSFSIPSPHDLNHRAH